MTDEQQHPLARYFSDSSELGARSFAKRSNRRPMLAWMVVTGITLLAAAANVAMAATPYANASVEGALTPGVYGRIEIGTAPPPPVLYPQPIIIVQQPLQVQQPPLYLHVPPGHAKKWSKHCNRYNACGRPVYFVKVNGDDHFERVQYQKNQYRHGDYERQDDHDSKEHKYKKDKGHGNGKHKGDN